ncbi:acyl carrier protein [Nocardia pseudovaccinii]|uniref:acyl carrier protein n=1 Tax=Nocardia pseudovaccinii TaxID=189540 RepID=UPI0007C635F7|nr:phosphopantetheine-binding protein [Nocardia pseudovaccinii]
MVITSVADAIGLKETRISRESSLIDELGAESIDLLDMWFRIHRDSGVEISGADVAALLRGDIPDDGFAERGGQRGRVGPSRASTTAVPPRFTGPPTAK